MSEIWHAERMHIQAIQTDNGTFVAQAFSLEDAAAIAKEHNAHDALLAACKAAAEFLVRFDEGYGDEVYHQVRAAIALATDSGTAEGGER